MKLNLTDSRRAIMKDQQDLATDKEGREILVGLSHEESVWYLDYQARRFDAEQYNRISPEEHKRWLEMADRHKNARTVLVGRVHRAVQDAEKDSTRH
jgi:hypothetical protein